MFYRSACVCVRMGLYSVESCLLYSNLFWSFQEGETQTTVKRRGPYRKREVISPGFQCIRCKTWYYMKKDCRKCEKRHAKEEKRSVERTCEICKDVFTRAEAKRRHIKEIHTEVIESVHQCGRCGSSFKRKGTLQKHLNKKRVCN